MSLDALTYRIALASVRGMNVDLAQKLFDVIADERTFFEMTEKELRDITGSRSKVYEDSYRHEQLAKARDEAEFVKQKNIRVLYFTQPDYPTRLLEAPDAPILLYISGEADLNATHIVSVVGTRHATPYGQRFTEQLIADLAEAIPGIMVVSGLAYGIDIAAHRACLRHHVPTVAVMAQGLNHIYPAQHRADAVAIVKQGGAIVTDYTSADRLHRGNFLARNRIIAALADCTVVAESAAAGGALVTASLAASYNRDVFALPGRTSDEFSTGCNRLIKSNRAALITSAADLLDAMQWEARSSQPKQMELFADFTELEQSVVNTLRDNPDIHTNELAARLALPVYRVMSTLMDLESRNVVISLPGSRFALA
ncbi:MAG: DNA-processing protein DprA [Muribaculaceae bacterium]|nr:DNA-processing protein DprA [Muribaculaceae bacterium]HAP50891.1 DNA-protecting protein DprA [Porphyromonadaceae bacterium]